MMKVKVSFELEMENEESWPEYQKGYCLADKYVSDYDLWEMLHDKTMTNLQVVEV